MPLDLLVPDLLLPPDAPAELRELRLPALERWLARADMEHGAAKTAAECLASAFALPTPAPIAAITLAADAGIEPGAWLRADPVHMRVERDSLTLHDASILDVTRAEADALVATLQALFAPDIEFRVAAPDRWYARVAAAELPATTPLATARGRDVYGMLPAGKGRINWRAAITEAQMVMGNHDVNVKREAAGAPMVNSVWFWGEGVAPTALPKPYAEIYADDAFAAGLAMLSGARGRAVPARLADIELAKRDDSLLVVLDTLTRPLHRVDTAGWRAAAERLDDAWFQHLGDAVARFDRVRIVLPSDSGSRIANLTPAARRRWFRRRKPLAAHA
jgi:hypothetical protein